MANSVIQIQSQDGGKIYPVTLNSNRNLLDNPWLTVNQRGKNSYSLNGYTVDRWKIDSNVGAVTVNSKGITLNRSSSSESRYSFIQIFENLLDAEKEYTASIMFGDGTIKSFSFYGTNTIHEMNLGNNCSFRVNGNSDIKIIVSNEIDLDVLAVKLELGSVSTIAYDAIPDYGEELQKCQRYFVRYTNFDGGAVGFGFMPAANMARISVCLPVSMRAKPNVSVSNLNEFKLYIAGSNVSLSGIAVNSIANNTIRLDCTCSQASAASAFCYLKHDAVNGFIDFSADF